MEKKHSTSGRNTVLLALVMFFALRFECCSVVYCSIWRCPGRRSPTGFTENVVDYWSIDICCYIVSLYRWNSSQEIKIFETVTIFKGGIMYFF